METKTCGSCNKIKSITEFYKRSDYDGYASNCKECRKEKSTIWKMLNPLKNLEYVRKYNKTHPEVKSKQKDKRRSDRLIVLEHYGGCCACCGESRFEFLAIDHIEGNGNKHRKETTSHMARWIVKNNFPNGFRILCHNCNQALGVYGYCPHSK